VNTNSTDQKQRLIPSGDTQSATKKPYVKPMVRHERVFETMALTCGKVSLTQSGCSTNRKAS
jgi:hypothetical protein